MRSVARRKPFTKREDEMLKKLVSDLGDKDWSKIAKKMSHRSAKQCRDRYNNYLSSNFKIGHWTDKEIETLKNLVEKIGPKWVEISKLIIDRSPNDLKNRWYKHILKKKERQDVVPEPDIKTPQELLNLDELDEDQLLTMFSIAEPTIDDTEE